MTKKEKQYGRKPWRIVQGANVFIHDADDNCLASFYFNGGNGLIIAQNIVRLVNDTISSNAGEYFQL